MTTKEIKIKIKLTIKSNWSKKRRYWPVEFWLSNVWKCCEMITGHSSTRKHWAICLLPRRYAWVITIDYPPCGALPYSLLNRIDHGAYAAFRLVEFFSFYFDIAEDLQVAYSLDQILFLWIILMILFCFVLCSNNNAFWWFIVLWHRALSFFCNT